MLNISSLLSSLWVSRTGSASDWCALQEALYKCIDTIQYAISSTSGFCDKERRYVKRLALLIFHWHIYWFKPNT